MKVVFFAQSREQAGCGEWHLEVEQPITIPEFWRRLGETFPALAPLQKTARLARRENYLAPDQWIEPRDEIAVLPPVSGG
jgi:molybdopterin converting factor subunit 1